MNETLHQLTQFILPLVIVGVPVLAFSLRFALKPMVEAYTKLKLAQEGGSGELPIMKQQLALLDQRLQSLEDHMDRLDEVVEFHRQLEKPKE